MKSLLKTIFTFMGLIYSILSFASKQIDSLSIFSKSMNKNIPAAIVLPNSYFDDTTSTFPVIYLLHGYSGNYKGYIDHMLNIRELANTNRVIFVCPDGGYGSWYFDSPIDEKFKYETHIATEVVDFIDTHYRTIKKREFRGIVGLSMGGHGALYLTIKHTDIFGIAGSMSGGVDFREFPDSWDIKKRLGKYDTNKQVWNSHTVIELCEYWPKNTPLLIDCGVKDFMIDVNRKLHLKLLSLNIDHTYTERPGDHNWAYWKVSTLDQIEFVSNYFNNLLLNKK